VSSYIFSLSFFKKSNALPKPLIIDLAFAECAMLLLASSSLEFSDSSSEKLGVGNV